MVPSWNGHGKTVIEYLSSIVELVCLSPQMVVDLGAMAPLKFTDRAQKWWQTQTVEFCNLVSQSWILLYKAIQVHFLNEIWVQKRTAEWEEMCFCQKGHENEWPLDFVQRRILYHMFLFPNELDGPSVIAHLLRNAPDVWLGTVNSTIYHDVFSLKAALVIYCPTLMANWNNAIKLGNLNQYYPRRCAHVVEVEEEEDTAGLADAVDSKTMFAANGFTRPRSGNPKAGSSKSPAPAKPRWPKGKTVKGYTFVKRDDIHSERPPPGGCYICTSDKHYARDCPHYGTWLTMRDANMIDSSVDSVQESEDLLAYLAMMVEVNGTDSDYGRELAKVLSQRAFGKDVHVVDSSVTRAARAHVPLSQ
jgi:hypothetical protein